MTELKHNLFYNDNGIRFIKGNGMHLIDEKNECYLDFMSGIAVNSLGHQHPAVSGAILNQISRFNHLSNLYISEEALRLINTLKSISFAHSVFLSNSGTEANEAALKLSRLHFYRKGLARKKVVAFEGGFHGRSFGSLSVTHKESYRLPFEPLISEVVFLDPRNPDLNLIDQTTSSVIIEPIQGEAGVISIPTETLIDIRKQCTRVGAHLIFDEIQCGLGRTGSLFYYQTCSVTPDILTLAKALGGGLPLGATLVNESIFSTFQAGDHGSTFGGNPVSCAAANAVLEIISNPAFLSQVKEMSLILIKELECIAKDFNLPNPRVYGLMAAIDIPSLTAQAFVNQALKNKLCVTSSGQNTIRLLPALICNAENINEFSEKFRHTLNQLMEKKAHEL